MIEENAKYRNKNGKTGALSKVRPRDIVGFQVNLNKS